MWGGGATGMEELLYKEGGYDTWNWRGHKINYVVEGEGNGEPIVLVHGFGASVYHWRYNVPALAKKHRVYAIDLLGFGWSDKALVDYSAAVWRDQLADFVREVVKEPAVLAGNSVGGYAVLGTGALNPDVVRGVGAAGARALVEETALAAEVPLLTRAREAVAGVAKKAMVYATFWQAKQPARIKSVLQMVYKDTSNVDDELVESIVRPTRDANAAEVYYRLTTKVLLHPSARPVDDLLADLKAPLLLLWGDLDPWMTPSKADRIMQLHPGSERVRLQAGHCPHDEKPEAVNAALLAWMAKLGSSQ
eukprot:jgi/Mesen1/9671/ME000674S09278